MRKFLIGSALTIMTATALFSCNNGKYDALPDVDNSAGLNHLIDDSLGVKVFLGTMEGPLNDKHTVFSPAFCYQDDKGIMHLVARIKDDTVLRRTLRITYKTFEGKRVDEINSDAMEPMIEMIMVDVGKFDMYGRQIYKRYTVNTGEGFGYGKVDIQGVEGGHLRGYLFGQLYKQIPKAPVGQPQYDRNEFMDFELTNFYFEKVPFPVTGAYKKYLQN